VDTLVIFGAALLGAFIGAYLTHVLPKRDNRRRVALDLLHQYTSPDFFAARAETWTVIREWKAGDRSCVDYFVRQPSESHAAHDAVKGANGLTPHQNLSWVLHFFTSLYHHYDAKLVDGNLLRTLFQPHYQWYEGFFHEFFEEYLKRAADNEPKPAWLSALLNLECRVFHGAQDSSHADWASPTLNSSPRARPQAPI
jgi:hypothetical protein